MGAAARVGNYGLRMVNATGQYSFVVKALPSAVADSSSIFWVKLGSGSGLQMLAQARDSSSSANMWQLYYDWGRGGFVFYPFTNTGSTEIFTGVGTGAVGLVDEDRGAVQRPATNGGSRIYLNGLTQPTLGRRPGTTRGRANLAVLQLWNDAVGTTDFDDARIPPSPRARRRSRARRPASRARRATRRGQAELDRAGLERRQRDQRLPDHAVHRRDTRRRRPSRDYPATSYTVRA